MKKTFGKVLVALLVSVAFISLVGCNNNADSGGGGGPAIDNRLVGTWEISAPPDANWAQYIDWLPKTVTFKADMTAPVDVYTSGSSGWNSSTTSVTGTWSVSGNALTLTPPPATGYGPATFSYSISADGKTVTCDLGGITVTYNKQ